jgi:hypothetical protein
MNLTSSVWSVVIQICSCSGDIKATCFSCAVVEVIVSISVYVKLALSLEDPSCYAVFFSKQGPPKTLPVPRYFGTEGAAYTVAALKGMMPCD